MRIRITLKKKNYSVKLVPEEKFVKVNILARNVIFLICTRVNHTVLCLIHRRTFVKCYISENLFPSSEKNGVT